jgi:hypothetical protein
MKHIQSEQLRNLLANQKVTPRWLSKARRAYRNANFDVDEQTFCLSLCAGGLLALVIVLILT